MEALRYKLTDYLENRVLIKNTGTCKSCGKSVYWSREKVNSHKRSKNCTEVTEDELSFFQKSFPSAKKRKTENVCEIKAEKTIVNMVNFLPNKETTPPKTEVEVKRKVLLSPVKKQLTENVLPKSESSTEKEEKFINVIYPNFKGFSKLKLIDEILELKRKNEILEDKVKTYAKAINDLL